MIPGDEGERLAVRRETRCGEEVMAGSDDRPLVFAAIQTEQHDAVDGLAIASMIFPNGVDEPAAGFDRKVGIAQLLVALRRQRGRRLTRLQAIEALIREIRGEQDAVRRSEGAAAIFMHPRADVEGRRRQVIDGLPVAPQTDDRAPARFLRPGLQPENVDTVGDRPREADLGGCQAFGRDRRTPGSKGCCHRHRDLSSFVEPAP